MLSKRVCPNCGSEDVEMIGSGKFMCKNCGYSGEFPEKEILGREENGR